MNPFFIHGPALVSFSGGRTSAYMLYNIIQSGLQDDVHVVFSNTGKERSETLDFVDTCAKTWGVHVHWIEYWRETLPEYRSKERAEEAMAGRRIDKAYLPPGKEAGFREVSFKSASRHGEPFDNMIDLNGVPHSGNSICTQELKIRPMGKFMRSMGYDHWTMVLGIRADEPRRVANMSQPTRERWDRELPLARAGITSRDVMEFWSKQSFDLQLRQDEGNCDLCHKKDPRKLARIAKEHPEFLPWWIRQEERTGRRLIRGHLSYRQLPVYDGEAYDTVPCHCHD